MFYLDDYVIDWEIHTEDDLSNYFKTVSEHKEIYRIHMGLQGAMYLLQPDVIKIIKVRVLR